MSKYLKSLITVELRHRLQEVHHALLVNVVGLDANATNRLRGELRSKGIHLMVVKNSLARRATEGTPLGPMFEGLAGSAAVCWGGEDVVALAREVARLAENKEFEGFEARGGVMEGQPLSSEEVKQVSRWPSREQLLSQLIGQIVGPGAALAGSVIGPGAVLAGQISQLAEESEDSGDGASEGAPA